MGTKIRFSIAFHPHTSGKVERVNQVLEDMLRACVISFGMKWEDYLPFAEFSYNSSYQASSGKAPFDILYAWEEVSYPTQLVRDWRASDSWQ